MNAEKTKEELKAFQAEFSKITRAKHPLEIEHFVVGSHTSRWRQWYQLCIECDNRWTAVQEAEGKQQLAKLEIEELEIKIQRSSKLDMTDRMAQIEVEKLKIELQQKRNQFERAKGYMVGALKEIQDYLHLAKTKYEDFWGKSEDEWVKDGERDYWLERLSGQIAVDLLTYGRVQAGNLNVLLQAPKELRADILRLGLAKQRDYNHFALPVQRAHEELVMQDQKNRLEVLS